MAWVFLGVALLILLAAGAAAFMAAYAAIETTPAPDTGRFGWLLWYAGRVVIVVGILHFLLLSLVFWLTLWLK